MTPQELKNSILQRAIEGKLVDQRPEEGNASNIIKELLNEKQKLLEEGKLYKKKPTAPFFDGDYPFDIPETWSWVQLSDVSIIQEGAGIRKYQYKVDGIQLLCVTNILESNIDLAKKQLFVSEKEYFEKYQHLTPLKGDILTACSGGSWGKVAIYNLDDTIMLNTSTLRMRFFGDLSNNKYLYYVTQSAFFKEQLKRQLVGIQPNFGYAHYSRIEFPLPPLAEQKRIVEKIEEIMPLVDEYEKNWQKLEELNKKFHEDMKKSILQEAIKGKLVEQRPEEGTGEELYKLIQEEKNKLVKEGKIKKQKPLEEIKEDEIPFDIPENWKWVRLGDVVNIVSSRRVHKSDWKSEGIPFYRAREIGKLSENGYVDNELFISEELFNKLSKSGVPQPGDLMVTAVGTLGKTYIVLEDDKFYYKDASVICFENFSNIVSEYLKFVMHSEMMMNQIRSNSGGTTVATLTISRTSNYLIPLPPLAEQKRIVEKLDEMLPYCDELLKII